MFWYGTSRLDPGGLWPWELSVGGVGRVWRAWAVVDGVDAAAPGQYDPAADWGKSREGNRYDTAAMGGGGGTEPDTADTREASKTGGAK